jgi:hypothetical protein
MPGPDGGGAGCAGCGGCGGCCYPGHKPCDCCDEPENCVGRFFYGVYQCICCPDPCYLPHWVALADSAFFQDGARPITQLGLRFDHGWHMPFPDKAEYFLPRSDGKGMGPSPVAGFFNGTHLSYRDFSLYNEAAIDRFSASIAIPYRQISPDGYLGASGFADLVLGTKSLLLDCELIQFTFGFKTYLPTGNFNKGLGTGHVSLEPALLTSIKCTPETYVQSEVAYWIPVGGDTDFQGPVFHYHLSLNHVLWHCGHDVQLIGTAELNGYEFLGGRASLNAAVNPVLATSAKNVADVLSVGPGVRLVICDKIDLGVGSAFAVTDQSISDQFLRVDFRWRF